MYFLEYHLEGSDTIFKSSDINPHIKMKLSDKECRIISSFQKDFEKLGLLFQLWDDNEIEVKSVPTCLLARELREVCYVRSLISCLTTKWNTPGSSFYIGRFLFFFLSFCISMVSGYLYICVWLVKKTRNSGPFIFGFQVNSYIDLKMLQQFSDSHAT